LDDVSSDNDVSGSTGIASGPGSSSQAAALPVVDENNNADDPSSVALSSLTQAPASTLKSTEGLTNNTSEVPTPAQYDENAVAVTARDAAPSTTSDVSRIDPTPPTTPEKPIALPDSVAATSTSRPEQNDGNGTTTTTNAPAGPTDTANGSGGHAIGVHDDGGDVTTPNGEIMQEDDGGGEDEDEDSYEVVEAPVFSPTEESHVVSVTIRIHCKTKVGNCHYRRDLGYTRVEGAQHA